MVILLHSNPDDMRCNTDDTSDVMTNMAKDIDTQIENAQLSKSNTVVEEINKNYN